MRAHLLPTVNDGCGRGAGQRRPPDSEVGEQPGSSFRNMAYAVHSIHWTCPSMRASRADWGRRQGPEVGFIHVVWNEDRRVAKNHSTRNRQEATCRVMGEKDQRQAAEGTAASPHTSSPVHTMQLPGRCRTLRLSGGDGGQGSLPHLLLTEEEEKRTHCHPSCGPVT